MLWHGQFHVGVMVAAVQGPSKVWDPIWLNRSKASPDCGNFIFYNVNFFFTHQNEQYPMLQFVFALKIITLLGENFFITTR